MRGGTEVITLGRAARGALGTVQPAMTMQWLSPPPGSPTVPQNLMRPTLQNGPSVPQLLRGVVRQTTLGNARRVLGLGAPGDDEAAPGTPPVTELGPPANAAEGVVANAHTIAVVCGVLGAMGAAAGAFHGYKRNRSIGWAAVWAVSGAVFPLVTPAIALAQGFGKRKGR